MKLQGKKGDFIIIKKAVKLTVKPLHPLKDKRPQPLEGQPALTPFQSITEYEITPRVGFGQRTIEVSKNTKGMVDKIPFKLDHKVRRNLFGGYYYQSQYLNIPKGLHNRTFYLDISKLTSDDIEIALDTSNELCVEIPPALAESVKTKEDRVDLSAQRWINIGYED